MFDYHVVLGIVASVVGVASFVPYFRDIFWGKTKPHPFTWLIWALITSIAFFAQLAAGGGPGAWVSGVLSLECLAVALLAFRRGEREITSLDWWCLSLGLTGLFLWQLTNNPLTAVILVTITDALAGLPTFRKSYSRPQEETISSYALGALRSLVSLPALTSFNLTTALYPVFIAFADGALVLFLLIRRRQLSSRA